MSANHSNFWQFVNEFCLPWLYVGGRCCRREKWSLYEINLNLLDPDDVTQIMQSMCDLL